MLFPQTNKQTNTKRERERKKKTAVVVCVVAEVCVESCFYLG